MRTARPGASIAACFLLVSQLVTAQVFDWATQTTGTGNEVVKGLSTDPSGNHYMTGYHTGLTGFTYGNTTPLPAFTFTSGFVTKTDPAGTPVWVKGIEPFGMNASSQPYDIAADAQGNTYVVGQLVQGMAIDNLSVTDTSYSTMNSVGSGFIAKLDPNGQGLWIRYFPSGPNGSASHVRAVHVDPSGSPVFSGVFNTDVYVDNTLLSAPQSVQCAFLARYDPNGNFDWVEQVNNPNNSGMIVPELDANISSDASGNLYWTTFNRNNATLAGTTLTNEGYFLAKFSPTGQLIWNEHYSWPIPEHSLDVSPSGIYGCIEHSDSLVLNGTTYYANGTNQQLLFFRMDTAANYDWITWAFVGDDMECRGLTADSGGAYASMFYPGIYPVLFPNGATFQAPGTVNANTILRLADTAFGLPLWVRYLPEIGGDVWDLEISLQGTLGIAARLSLGTIWGTDTLVAPISGSEIFNGSMQINTNIVSGRIFRDWNADGNQDPGEPGIPAPVDIQPAQGLYAFNYTGVYQAHLPSGTFTIQPSAQVIHHTCTPASHTVTFSFSGQTNPSNDFACVPIPGIQDLNASITASTPRPGFSTYVWVRAQNVGSVAAGDSISFTYDSLLSFTNSVPLPASHVGNTLTWAVPNLPAFSDSGIFVHLQVPANAILGDSLAYSALVTPLAGDTLPASNTDSLKAEIVGSYDPNDKQVFPAGDLTPQQVANSPWLTYLVRFQNTGTDTAFNVIIRDTLDPDLDHTTLDVLEASDPYTVSYRDGGLTFSFNNILLPDSNVNEPESHGFVKYRIKPKPTLVLGDQITNTAYIYFDFNAPIVTNTTVTEIAEPVSVPINAATLSSEILVFPNPGNGTFQIQASGLGTGPVILAVYDLTGRVILQRQFPNSDALVSQPHQLHGPAGIYLIRVAQEGQEPAFIRYIHR